MSQFILAYHGGQRPKTKEDGQAHMKNWMAWTESLGDAVVNAGMYFGQSKTVSSEGVADNGGTNPINGITILEAESIDEILDMAARCPHINIGGTIEVAPVMQM